MTTFGPLLRSCRLRAGLGLRTFAGMMDERASTVSAVESGRRAPWRHDGRLARVAEVLGLVETSELWRQLVDLTRNHSALNGSPPPTVAEGSLAWWLLTDEAPQPDRAALDELAAFLGAELPASTDEVDDASLPPLPALTELAIEWRVRHLLGRRNWQVAAAPVDVEAALEGGAGVRLEIVPGLIPRFSVQACAVHSTTGLTLVIDRIVADSRPLASYRHLLANCYAPAAVWDFVGQHDMPPEWFFRLRASDQWAQALRACQRFALAMLLPADPVLAGAETAYRELVEQQGWVETEDGIRSVRNRLAELFAVPPAVVHRRLVGWPCHLYGRIAQALAAQEPTLPPTDWLVDDVAPRQRTLFDVDKRDCRRAAPSGS